MARSTTLSSSRLSSFRVVTDSTADLPEAWRSQFGIEVVPLNVIFGNESFKDRVELSNAEFFARLASASQLPTTSAPAPGEFAKVYERLSRECDAVISIHIGSSLSGTADAARNGAHAVAGFPVHVVDSRSVTMTIAFLCRIAAESATVEEALASVEERVPRQRVLALLDTLRYLQMGGRIKRAEAMIGSILDLKPILGLANGEIKSVDRVRTRGKAISRMMELLTQDLPAEHVAVVHAQAPDEAETLREQLSAHPALKGVEVEVGQIGAVLATHTGPQALGLVYIKAEG